MQWNANLTNLKDVLADLYPLKEDSIRIIRDAELILADISFNDRARTNWSNILDEANKRGKVANIINAALRQYPDNPYLLSAQRGVLSPVKPLISDDLLWHSQQSLETLEKITGRQSTLLPIGWLEIGTERARSIAKVKLADGSYGTGILIRNNYLLTNHHVLAKKEDAKTAIIQFNYQRHPSGRSNDPVDVQLNPAAGFYTSETHDWTLVRVQGDANARWGAIDLEPAPISINDRANIIQHPGGEPKQIACYHNIVAYVNDTIVQYLTDTLPGSSGSAVFNSRWQLIALHHEGGMITEPGSKKFVYRNEGINVNCILRDIERLNL
jgi:V8-like Glu-specific endopeptidase